MRHRVAATVAALALLAAPPVAAQPGSPAPPETYDTVVLRDGSVVRGTILELVPGRSVTIDAAVGGARTIAWAEVASTSLSSGAAPSASLDSLLERPVDQDMPPETAPEPDAPLPPSVAASEAAPEGPGGPRLFIELTRPAEVHLLEVGAGLQQGRWGRSRGTSWMARSVCRAPCGKRIDGGAGYPFVFGGDRMPPSRQFYLTDLEGDVVARVRPGRLGLLAGGVALLSLGYAGSLSGGLLTGLGRDETRTAGAIVLGAGVALLIAGIGMLVGGTTRYKLRRR